MSHASDPRVSSTHGHAPDADGPAPGPIDAQEVPMMARHRKTAASVGWICPACGSGLAPSTTRCPCRSGTASIVVGADMVDAPPILCTCPRALPVTPASADGATTVAESAR